MAQALAEEVGELRQRRAGLAELLAASPQWQVKEFAVNFGSRLWMMWKDWLRETV